MSDAHAESVFEYPAMTHSRRQFLEISLLSGGGLLASFGLPEFARAAAGERPVDPRYIALGAFVRIHADNSIVIGARGCEIGQGVVTSLPMLIAEELDVRWDQVRVEQLPYGLMAGKDPGTFAARYGGQGAGGSTNIPDAWTELRQAGVQIRQLLVTAAAQLWEADAKTLKTGDAMVSHPDGRTATYGSLAARAAQLPLPAGPFELKKPADFRIIGKPTKTADCADIVSGKTRYGIDAQMPGMLFAVIARCPYFEGTLKSLDDAAAKKIRGVRAVVPIASPPEGPLARNLAAGVAVVADNTWAAMQGRKALKIEWTPGPWAADSTQALEARCRAAVVGDANIQSGRSDGDMKAAWTGAARKIEADYKVPFLAHSTMEPPGATIHIAGDRVKLIASLQSPGGASRMIHAMTGVPRLNIDIELPRSGGGFGRRLANDFVGEAVQVGQAVKQPVKLIWTRDDDLQTDFYRPFGVQRLRAAADKDGRLTGWSHRVAATSRRFRAGMDDAPDWVGTLDPDGFPAACVPNYLAEFVNVDFGLARGWWRAPLHTFSSFATQSFVDEVAFALKRDPLELRLEMLGAPRDLEYKDHGGPIFSTGRLAAVMREAAKRIGYGRKLPKGRGIGLACHFTFGGYAAHAIEVSAKGADWRIERCVCVADVGQVVNPTGVEAQLMGATIDGLSSAIGLQITVANGRIEQSNFDGYPLMRMPDAPPVETFVLPSTLPPSGAGEMGIPSAAPALANAIFAATGKRLRNLPLRAG
ncbi:MAG TPA: molybdopterin cofactor-binding domain-containing protein [Steroidobacteraceae bacterium]|nr:molybdopterin cofactor-binding domain-containing protein [Steroidobacteraceae bacterium]